jgi:excisionase family DNA binding protein
MKKGSGVAQKTLLTPREASQRLSVSVATVYWWYAMGKIDGVNISGGTLRLFASSLRDFCNLREARQGHSGACEKGMS